MARVTNTDSNTRHWTSLVNAETGGGLELAPGESAEVDLPNGFEDPFLKTEDDLGDYEPPAPTEEAPEPPAAPQGIAFPSVTTDPSAMDV